MTRKKLTPKSFDNVGGCCRKDGDGIVFSVAEFLRLNQLPDDPELRAVVIWEMHDMFPDVRVLEEED
jgi:hypothetical protein